MWKVCNVMKEVRRKENIISIGFGNTSTSWDVQVDWAICYKFLLSDFVITLLSESISGSRICKSSFHVMKGTFYMCNNWKILPQYEISIMKNFIILSNLCYLRINNWRIKISSYNLFVFPSTYIVVLKMFYNLWLWPCDSACQRLHNYRRKNNNKKSVMFSVTYIAV